MTPPPTDKTLRILCVEDRPTDTELMIRELRKHHFSPSWVRVETEDEFLRRLDEPWDLITVDATLPQFGAARALELLGIRRLDTPCLVVSGSIGEEDAVALIRAGASDYLMKDRLGRLGQAVQHVLEQRKLRKEHAHAHENLVKLNIELEQRVAHRTAELERVNQDLARELDERTHIEALLRNHETRLEERVARRTAQLERSQNRLRRLASQLTLTEQAERKRLAADLHDYLAQLLVVSRLKVHQLVNHNGKDDTGKVLHELDTHIDQMLTYTRTLVAQLSPEILFRRGLVPALRWLGENMLSHGLNVTVTCTDEPNLLSEDHAVLLYQSVRELLYNIRKHAQTSDAFIEINTDSRCFTIIVRDNGIGFDETLVSEKPGSFGLFSIRERVEGMFGTVTFQSSPGQGTTVALSIPRTTPTTHPLTPPRSVSEPPHTSPHTSTHRLHVIVADDHTELRQELVHLLPEIGPLEVVGEASNGREAIELAKQLVPDLILMDINMPIINGIDATRAILADHPSIRVIGVTMHEEAQIRSSLVEAGAAATVTKSKLHSELWPTIKKAFHLS